MRLSRRAVLGVIFVVLVALLIPVVRWALEAGNRAHSANGVQQIALAMLSEASSNDQTFPPRAILDKQGKPLLSWRVRVLRSLDCGDLYREFHLDERWDSEHNKKLIAKIPFVFRDPSSAAPPGATTYVAVCGKGLMFEGMEGRKLADVCHGFLQTIMLVQVDDDRAVPWSKPDDWEYDPDDPLAGLGHVHPEGFLVAWSGGSVQFLSKTIDPKKFHAMLTIAGGEPFELK
jgi:hypothetical protein